MSEYTPCIVCGESERSPRHHGNQTAHEFIAADVGSPAARCMKKESCVYHEGHTGPCFGHFRPKRPAASPSAGIPEPRGAMTDDPLGLGRDTLTQLLDNLAFAYMRKGEGHEVPGVAGMRLRQYVRGLEAEVDRLRATRVDAERIDWIESAVYDGDRPQFDLNRDGEFTVEFKLHRRDWFHAKSLREAIDAARAAAASSPVAQTTNEEEG